MSEKPRDFGQHVSVDDGDSEADPVEQAFVSVPYSEIEFETLRSSGPGGQNVNKTETKVRARWNFEKSTALTSQQKNLIREKVSPANLTNGGEVMVSASSERSQLQNKNEAVRLLNECIQNGLAVQEERKPTAPTKGSKERRLEGKKKDSALKRQRSSKNWD